MKKSIQINLVRGFRKEHLFSWEIPTGLKMYVNALDPPVVATLQPGATRREVLTDFIWQHVFKCGSPVCQCEFIQRVCALLMQDDMCQCFEWNAARVCAEVV